MGGQNSGGKKKYPDAPDWRNRKAYRSWYAKQIEAKQEKVKVPNHYYDLFVDYASDCGHMTPRYSSI